MTQRRHRDYYSVWTSCYGCSGNGNTLDDTTEEITTTSARLTAASYSNNMDTTPMRSMSLRQHPEDNRSPLVRSRSQERIVVDNKETESTDDTSASQCDDSERVGQPVNQQQRTLQRSMSDPFDAQEDAASNKSYEEDNHKLFSAHVGASSAADDFFVVLPTFPRYPVGETRNKNCFSEPSVSIFHVRGPKYFVDKKKIPSPPYLLQARGCDLFLTESKNPVELDDKDHLILGGQLRRKPTLAVNFRFPWGYMCLYFEIPQNLTAYMNGNTAGIDRSLSPPEQTLAAWFQGDEDYKNDRLKLIPYVAEGPWVVRNMVTGRPAIIGRKLPVSYDLKVSTATEAPLLTATLDIGSSSATAKRIVSVCRRYMSALTVDIGFVIQAQVAEELPEQMLGSIRVHHPDPLKAHKL